MNFRISIMSGSRAGQELTLPGPMIRFGRDPSNEVAFDPVQDDKISTNHAQLLLTDNGQILLTDLNSSNGTLVNGQKIARPTPIASGSMVMLGGEDGVQVAIALVNPNDPNALKATMLPGAAPVLAEEPPQKSGKGKVCLLLGCLGLLLTGMIALVVYFATGGEDEPQKTGEVAEKSAAAPEKTAAEKTPAEKTAAEKTAPEKTPEVPSEPAAEETFEHPWQRCGVGSRFVLKGTTEGAAKSSMTMEYELLELNDERALVQMKTISEIAGMDKPLENVTKVEMPFKAAGEGEEVEPLDEKEESVEVPAGSFDCTYRKLESEANGMKTTSESWTSDELPVPVKSVTTLVGADGKTMSTTTMELIEVEKK